jgi:protein-disulfide isomerase
VIDVVQRTQYKSKNTSDDRQRIVLIISAVAVIALFAVIAYVIYGNQSRTDYSNIPMERTADGAFILGNPEAAVTIVAWEDFLCPHCQAYESTIEDFIVQYVATGQARFEFRMLIAIDPTYSALAFQLVECAELERPGSFFTARETMFRIATTSRFNANSGREFASQMGMPYGALLNCTSEADQYTTDMALANQFGENVSGTPAVGWRMNGGEVRFDVINRQPTLDQIGTLISMFSQAQ